MAFVARCVVRYRVKVVRKNLDLCFPDKSRQEKRSIEKAFYVSLCDIFMETVKLLHISDGQLQRRVTLSNTQLINDIVAQHRPIILFLAHYGNWEWVPALTLSLDAPREMGALYKPLRNKVMNRVALRLRARFHSECIPVASAYRTLVEMRAKTPSFMIGFIADQRALGVSLKHWTYFFGQETSFYGGAETIGDRVGARYVYLDVQKVRRGYYNLTFKEIIPATNGGTQLPDFPYTRTYFTMLEQTIRRAPQYWLWSHNRWKKRR